jgi:hypothetical protein
MIEKNYLIDQLEAIERLELVSDVYDGPIDERIINFSKNHIKQENKAILGLDIFKYSEFDEEKQTLIPFIFDILLDGGFLYASKAEPSLFQGINNIRENYVSTGDGGFLIFPSPVHALVFNLYFFAALHIFNSGHFASKLSQYVGNLTIRSVITFDKVFNYENNWYGKGIIKNARILSKDKLNRFIIDKETYDYFMRNFNGIETLSIVDKKIFIKVMNFDEEFHSILFDGRYKDLLKNIHVQKIEDTLAKSTKLNIFNIEIQFNAISTLNDQTISYIFTVGNSNAINIE